MLFVFLITFDGKKPAADKGQIIVKAQNSVKGGAKWSGYPQIKFAENPVFPLCKAAQKMAEKRKRAGRTGVIQEKYF